MSRADAIKDGEGGSAGTARCEVPAGQLVGQLGGKSLFGQVMALALWPFLQNLMGVGVGFTDMIIAGRIQVEDTKAIFDMMGASMYLVWLLMILQMGMGVTGLALGTVMGWAAGAVLILWFLRPGSKLRREASDEIPLELRLGNLRYDAPMLRRIWTVSWPSIFEIMGMWSVHAIGIYFIGKLQAGALGAHAMVVRFESTSFMPGFALGMAASTLASQYLGAGNPEMARKAVRFCWLIAVIAMGATCFLPTVVWLTSPECRLSAGR